MEEPPLREFRPLDPCGNVRRRQTNVEAHPSPPQDTLCDVKGHEKHDEADRLNGNGRVGSKEQKAAGSQRLGQQDQHAFPVG